MKLLSIFISLLLLLFMTPGPGCKKSDYNDLSGNYTLKGIIVAIDTLNGSINYIVYKNTKVFLKNTTDATGYLYSLTTDSEGKYIFTGIDPAVNYTIYAGSDTGSVRYEGKLDYTANNFADNQSDSLKLYASSKNQNGIHLIAQGIDGGRISGVTAWVFTNEDLFKSGTADGKVFDMTTNTYGVINKMNVAPGNYYFRIKTKIGMLDLQAEGNITIEYTGIKSVVLMLDKYSANKNGYELTINDIYGTPINNATVYPYRSLAIFKSDSNYTQSLGTVSSSAGGKATSYNIDAAKYYLRIIRVIGKDTLKAETDIDVPENSITTKPITLIK